MRSTIKIVTKPRDRYPQLFENKRLGVVWLYYNESKAIVVYADKTRGVYTAHALGFHNSCANNPYNNPELNIFEGTVELTNP